MKLLMSATAFALGLAMVPAFVPALAQAAPAKQHTDGEAPTQVGPGSKAYKQQSDGESPTVVGPGSQAYRQKTDGESPTIVGPGSQAYKH
ncbi:hypothetical protein [Rhodopila sp.]|uniref:hypothetical protein n=1 Tax=Rhodopila sp. TaxID=2480087 RepID=UPI002D801730|nr:hypothetical protein [Rhodopila sp.]